MYQLSSTGKEREGKGIRERQRQREREIQVKLNGLSNLSMLLYLELTILILHSLKH